MSNESEHKEDESQPVSLTASKAAGFKNRKRRFGASLTLREYEELSAQGPQALTPSEQKSLAEAQQQARKMAESLTSLYDFSAIAKLARVHTIPSIAQQSLAKALVTDTSPMMKVVADMQKLSLVAAQPALTQAFDIQKMVLPAIQAIKDSNVFAQNQFTALAAVQKSLVTFPTESILASVQGIHDAFQAPLIARTMLADFHTMHERILRNITFDVSSLTASVKFSRFETVEVAIDDVSTDDDSLAATGITMQTSHVGNVTFTDEASLRLAFNDLKQEVYGLRRQLLAKDNQQSKLLVAPSKVYFHRIGSSIQIGPYKVPITISSAYTRLARFLLSTPENITKKWDIEDLAREVFGAYFANAADEEQWKSKIKGYVNHFNQQVMIASGGKMPKFITCEGVEYFVNQEYLNL